MDKTEAPSPADRGSGSNDLLGQAPERAGVAWELALLAQTLEFSDDVRAQIQRGADEIERLQAAMSRQIDYERLIDDCFETTRQRQGSLGCRQFARGAEWWRDQVLKA